MRTATILATSALAMALAACSGGTDKPDESAPSSSTESTAADASTGPIASPMLEQVAATKPPASFNNCRVCHTFVKGDKDMIGPNLWGVYGQKAAVGSFNFSPALRESGLTFDEPTLDAWLENPRKLVPGNRMSFPGIRDATRRQEIIDYLKQLR